MLRCHGSAPLREVDGFNGIVDNMWPAGWIPPYLPPKACRLIDLDCISALSSSKGLSPDTSTQGHRRSRRPCPTEDCKTSQWSESAQRRQPALGPALPVCQKHTTSHALCMSKNQKMRRENRMVSQKLPQSHLHPSCQCIHQPILQYHDLVRFRWIHKRLQGIVLVAFPQVNIFH